MRTPATRLASPTGTIRLRCPCCGASATDDACPACGFRFGRHAGIVDALSPESRAGLADFVSGYERIREAEGRGSGSAAYYLALPYRDLSGRDPRQWRIRARSHDYLMRHLLPRGFRGDACSVLDLGAGNGWMSHRLALAGGRPVAVDLVVNDRDGLGAARHYLERLPEPFPRFRATFDRLPFDDGQFDLAVFNASFHYCRDGAATLREALRCVKPGGSVVISDTPWYPREDDGTRMLAERRVDFLARHRTQGDWLDAIGFLTDARLDAMARALRIRWDVHQPWYGPAWALRPLVAALRRRRAPARFRLYVARKPG
jgi:SAM-dependent methyltransferase